MSRSVAIWTALVVAVLALAACTGSGGSDPSTGPGSATPATPSTAPASATTSEAPTSAAPTAGASTGAGGAGEACDLLTADEIGTVIGTSIASTESVAGEPSYCQYLDADGMPQVATSYARQAQEFAWQMWAQEDGAVQVDVPGAEAVFSPSTETVYLRKGDAIVGVTAGLGAGATPTDQRRAWATELAAIVATRM
jgi:hypothetical protein